MSGQSRGSSMAVFGFEQLTSYCFLLQFHQNLQEKAKKHCIFPSKKPL